MTRFSLGKKQVSNPLMEEVCLSERLRTQLLPTSLDLVFMYPLDQFTKTEQSCLMREIWVLHPVVSTGEDCGGGAAAPHETIAKRLRGSGIGDARGSVGSPGKMGKMVERNLQIMGFLNLFDFFLGKLIKRQRWNLIALDMMIPLRLKKTFDIGIQSSNLGICRESR